MSLDVLSDLGPVQDAYYWRLPYACIIADYVWPGIVMSPKRINDIKDMQFDERDVVIVSYPKSGTTWMAELVSALNYSGDTDKLTKLRQDERVPWLELDNSYWWIKAFFRFSWLFGESKKDEAPKDNRCHDIGTKHRLCFTHLPLELLPKSILEGKCKVIYVARNPKDNAVSFFHFHRMARFLGLQKIDWNDFFALYYTGSVYCGSWFEHVLGYWNLAKKYPESVKFVKYEDMKDDFPGIVTEIADFLKIDLTPAQTNKVLTHCHFDSMKNNKMANRDTVWLFNQKISKFMRKGAVGDWKNYFTFVQSELFDELYKEKMAGSGLDFKFE
uniref:Sulfotransfer_1 domain-containing protein n=1 Tax=Panagrellus redivivus TaxID=6233 RepID=A0A7E4VK25_PANRE